LFVIVYFDILNLLPAFVVVCACICDITFELRFTVFMLVNFILPVACAGLFILLFLCGYSVYVTAMSRC